MRHKVRSRRINRQRKSAVKSGTVLLVVCAVSVISFVGSGLIMRQAYAEVITDGTVGAAQNLGGPNFVIPQSLGSTQGSNLFHSFQNFNIANTESATFSGANTLQNVISRVTGGQSSSINGVLRSQVGQAAFYFINPAGVVFGADAVVDVPGDFHVSTASELHFSDGAAFSVEQPNQSALSMATPAEFGFLSDQSSAVRVEQSNLTFSPNTTTSLSGGQIVINNGVLVNKSGEIRLAAMGLDNTRLPISEDTNTKGFGSLAIENSGISVNGPGAGQITITSGDTQITNSLMFADNTGTDTPETNAGITITADSLQVDQSAVTSNALDSGKAGNVSVSTVNNLEIINGGFISSNTLATGDAGPVNVQAGNLTINRQASEFVTGIFSNANPDSSGNAGSVAVTATKTANIINGGQISSNTFGDGNAGTLAVRADNLTINGQNAGFASISSNAAATSQGNAGTIEVSVTDSLNLVNGGVISSDTRNVGDAGNVVVAATETTQILNGGRISSITFATGDAGSVSVQADNLSIDRQASDSETGIFSTAVSDSTGNAGSIDVTTTEAANILNGGRISSDTSATGDAGSVNIHAGNLTIDRQASNRLTGISSDAAIDSTGNAGRVDITATETANVLNGGRIRSNTSGEGNAGILTIQANNLTINGQDAGFAGINSDATATSKGNAGTIEVSVTDTLNLVNGGVISSDTRNIGDAGNVFVEATGTANILNGGRISSNTFATGNADAVNVQTGNLTIDQHVSDSLTGIFSDATPDSSGNAGNVVVTATETTNILNGGRISSTTSAIGNAGSVNVQTDNLTIDRQDSDDLTGVFSDANPGSSGNAGNIVVATTETANILNGGRISSITFATGDAGSVNVHVGNLMLDRQDSEVTGIFSDTVGSSGNAGSVGVTAIETANIQNGGRISSSTFGAGNAGSVDVHADSLTIDRQASDLQTGVFSDANPDSSGNAGSVAVTATKTANIINGGQISSSTFGDGNAGTLAVRADNLTINGQNAGFASISSNAAATSQGNAGTIEVSVTDTLNLVNGGIISSDTRSVGDAGNVVVAATETTQILNGGRISSITFATGDAGSVSVQADSLSIDRQASDSETGIFSNTVSDSTGNAGSIDVTTTEAANILNGGRISSDTSATGDAGSVNIHAGNLTIDRQASNRLTGISSDAAIGSSGNAGNVAVTAAGTTNILNGGRISSITFATGDAGSVDVQADNLTINRQASDSQTGIFSNTVSDSTGNAGSVDVTATETAKILNGGRISSDTSATGNAGSVKVQVGNLTIDRQASGRLTGISSDADQDSSGNAGRVDVTATETANILNGGRISSITFATGDAGSVNVQAGSLTINRQASEEPTGISSDAATTSSGDAGNVVVTTTATANILNGGQISSNTFAVGNAGDIDLTAEHLVIDNKNSNIQGGIFSAAGSDSLGQAGNINLNTGSLSISNGGLISIESLPVVALETLATIEPAKIDITAGNVALEDSTISTQSRGNIPAGSISIAGANRLFLNLSNITSEANNADGGEIMVSGESAILQDGQITTSVIGQGNGGDISLDFKNLVLDTGFIQANTAGSGAQGGDIAINIDALIASGNVLLTGGNTPFSFEVGSGNNVIQAAAPDGVSGAIDNSSPELNIKGDLAGLTSDLSDVDSLVRDPCSIVGTQQSALVTERRGGLPETAQDALAVPLDRDRLQQIMADPDISGEGMKPYQSDVFLNRGGNHPSLAFAALEHDCRKH